MGSATGDARFKYTEKLNKHSINLLSPMIKTLQADVRNQTETEMRPNSAKVIFASKLPVVRVLCNYPSHHLRYTAATSTL